MEYQYAHAPACADPVAAELNAPQAEAVGWTDGPLLVFAGAGSGKTRVITYRVAHLVASYRVAPYRILAVTFTNKAAGEMRARLEHLLGSHLARELWVGTFHATCARLLRRYHSAANLGANFVIYDEADQRAVVNRVLKELSLDDRRYPARMVLSRIHKEKQEGRGPDEMVLKDWIDDKLLLVYKRYEQHLADANAIDFEDLILRVTRLVESKAPEADELRRRFQYVLVDEFQDTNHIQYRLVGQLAAAHRNLCVVGDDDQSIYRWRGADIRNIRNFRKDFPEARVVKLEQNYRSSARIVRAALAVIKTSRQREPKELWTANPDGNKVTVVATGNEREEAAFLVNRIRSLVQEGVALNEIAVFYRVHAQSRVLEEAFRAESVPYQIVGGTKFFDRAEIKDLLSYLRVLTNPRSDVDLLRIINVPARGIGATTIDRLVALADDLGTNLFDALERAPASADIGSAPKKRLVAFRALLNSLSERVFTMGPAEAAALVLDETGYKSSLETEDSAESDARLENLQELIGSILDYEEEARAAGETPSLAGYLERVTLAAEVDQLKDGPRIVLMTVHSAKGLEFRTVFLTGMEDELFPYKGLAPGEEEELEEERRLAYVAITRAREKLFITHTMARTLFGQTRYGRPSRFLLHLPPEDVEMVGTATGIRSRFIDRDDWSQSGQPKREPLGFEKADESPEIGRPDESDGAEVDPSGDVTTDDSFEFGFRASADLDPSESSDSAASPLPRLPGRIQEPGRYGRSPTSSVVQRRTGPSRQAPSAPQERYVDRSAFDDLGEEAAASAVFRRGAKVRHARFGEGVIRSVEQAAELMVVAHFPGWGEKKILARFLQVGS